MTEDFAAEALARMEVRDADLLPVLQRALADWDPDGAWVQPVLSRAYELYEDASGYPAGTQFRTNLRQTLLKTKDPAETAGDTAERLAKWVSTYIENAAEFVAGESGGTKTWLTQHDDRVRSVHAALDGKTIKKSERFDLDGAKLRYPGEPVGDPKFWIQCRCVLRTTKGADMAGENEALVAAGEETPPSADVPAVEGPEDENGPAVDDETMVPFHGVATVVDRPTGDRRQLAREGFAVRPLPLPVFYQRAQSEGHGGSTVVGQFTRMELNEAGEVEYDGFFNFTPEAGEAIQGVAEGWLRGVSVDLDDILVDYSRQSEADRLIEAAGEGDIDESEFMDAMQREVTVFKQWRVAGLTMVGIPAFHEAYIAIGPRPVADEEPDALAASALQYALALDQGVAPAEAARHAYGVTFAPGTHDGPGWITDPVPTGRIRRYWTHGEGAAKIGWGAPGDFNRCRNQLAKYIANPEWLAGACANMHKEATGSWPGRENGAHSVESLVAAGAKMAAAFNLVAAAPAETRPPLAWFQNPELMGPTPITIEGDRIYGHIATWGTCHIGFGDTCTEAPSSASNYSWFRLGAVETDSGLVPVGQITLGTGHADLRAGFRPAAAHYDDTGTAVADIAAGEDSYGIWFAGRLRPGVSAEQRAELLAAKLSGDWRRIQGNLELVAALAVNTPGFGIPRLGLVASAAGQTSLVAAGIVGDPDPSDPGVLDEDEPVTMARVAQLVEAGVRDALARRQRAAAVLARTERLRALGKAKRDARMAALRSKLGR